MDVKKGYGEMYWADGSIYRGFWDNGLQQGLGLMIFKDGLRKAGFFNANVYEKPLVDMKEFENYSEKLKIPESFRQEIKEYLGLLASSGVKDDYEKFIGQEFNAVENEDQMATNQFENMQEMANAPFGANGLSKEDYAKQVLEMELAE